VVNTNHHHGKQGGELDRNYNASVSDPLFLLTQYQNKKIAVWLHETTMHTIFVLKKRQIFSIVDWQ